MGVKETNLTPGLLLAMPHLDDPSFHRAVVLMIEHGHEGSFGLVVNNPSRMATSALLQSLDINWNGDHSSVVWSGGPVMPTSGWVLHEPTPATPAVDLVDPACATMSLAPGLHLSTSPENLRLIAVSPPQRVRVLLGYAGWGPGELASEMAQGSWLHADLSPQLIFDTPPEAMWERALSTIGIGPETLVPSRGIH